MLSVETRHARDMWTEELREHFIGKRMFRDGEIRLIYTHCDRFSLGGAVPAGGALTLDKVEETRTPSFLDPREMAIVNIASLLSFQGGIRVPAYTASKHGVAGVTKILANEWAPHRITVNAIAPGYIATNNTEALRDDPGRSKAIPGRIPAGRWGEPSDIGGTAAFLASPAATDVTGAVINVDGGWLAR
ncbi:short chain dehydrogenase [Salipiger thiooxidans]|uniref:Short chain dehydrogenase n=1 Tax=Salipiger thiooxidans TaxID=282683 RepID=A0A1G7J6R9_9RHOB|nr:SDR family oxidoreductase [Salipiger thiooxidans]SDF20565.1 short chain dehydrogenase [Salipiger thiooxidans]